MATKKKAIKKATKKTARKAIKKVARNATKKATPKRSARKSNAAPKGRLLAHVGVSAKDGEFVYYKDGNLYAVKRKVGGTRGAKKCSRK